MSDLDLTKKTNFSQNQNTGSSQNLKDQVVDAGAEMKQRAGDALRASTDIARDKFKEAADAAKDVASGTADQTPGPGAREAAVGRRFHRAICRQHPRSGPRLRERRTFRCPRHQFRRRICRGCRRENPQRELPRPRRQCDRFRETPARRIPWDLGARGLCGSALPQGIRRRRLIFIAQRYEPGVIFAARRRRERDFICSGELSVEAGLLAARQ